MRKFPKLLAIVLAIAIVICPAMCLTTMAASTATYDLAYEDGVLTVTVSAESGFLVSLLRIDVEGFAIDDEEGIAVATKEGRAFSANPAYDDVAGILSLVIAPKEPLDITTVTEATVTIEATELDVAERYYIALTKIQVADAGTAEDPESLLDIAGVAADGTVETVVPTVNRLPHVCEAVAEYVDNGDGTHNGLCECGEVLIENEEHSDENSDLSCDECEATLEAPHSCEVADYVDNGDGTHNGACECGEVLIENEEHSDENADNACDKCDAALEVEIPSLSTVFPVYTEVLPGSFEYRAGIAFTRDAAESLNITNYVTQYYGYLTEIGVIQTIDGTVPTIDNNISFISQVISDTSKFRTQGINLGKYVNFYGMNFDQFDIVYKTVGYVKYTDAQGESQYIYTDVITSVPFVQHLTENSDDALTGKILKAYNDYKGGAFASANGDVVSATTPYLPFTLSYDFATMEARATLAFTKANPQNVDFINYIESTYGHLTAFGIAESVDGIMPTIDNNIFKEEIAVSDSSKMRTQAINYTKYINYYGMNVNQLSTQYSAIFYVKYLDSNDVEQVVAIEELTFSVIEQLRAIEGNEAVTNLLEVYDAVS